MDALAEILQPHGPLALTGSVKRSSPRLRTAVEEARRLRILRLGAKEGALEASARTAMQNERDAAEAAWAERANMLAVEIAGRLVARSSTARS